MGSGGKDSSAAGGSQADAQHLIVIRHGDRWDYENPDAWHSHPYSRKADPPLSSLGHEQAREAGHFLDKMFQELGIGADDITWMASPFLRTIQTSTEAMSALTFKGSNLIPILPEPGVFEWDEEEKGFHACLPKDTTERAHYFPRLLESATTYKPLYVPPLPEPTKKFAVRCEKTIDALNERHQYKPKSALVVVTHAAVCIGFVAAAAKKPYNEITPAAPCGIYQLTRWSNDPVWHLDDHDAPKSMNGYTDHLTTMGPYTLPFNHFGGNTPNKYTGPPTSRFAPAKSANRQAAIEEKDNCTVQ